MPLSPQQREAAALSPTPPDPLRRAIDAACRPPEPDCVPPLIAAARLPPDLAARVHTLARQLVIGLRERRVHAGGVDALMKEFALSSHEGVALMCLAEALLRVPDSDTADQLIRDKLAGGDWRAHLGHSRSMFVNAASWGLLITGDLVSTRSEAGLAAALKRLVARGGEPVIRGGMDLAMRLLGEQFVAGRDIAEALERGAARHARGYRHSFDMLGEAAMTAGDAAHYLTQYTRAIHAIGNGDGPRGVVDADGISVKLSALHPRYVWAQRARVMAELLPRLKGLCLLARGYDIGLNIDAEEADRLALSLDVLDALACDPDLADWDGLGFVVQAYQKRAPRVIEFLIDLARRSGHRLMLRLVKGAYWDAEIKRAQLDGLAGYPVFTRKAYTDVSYLACARMLLAAREQIYPQFATHNAHTVAAIYHLAEGDYRPGDYEFQCLHGMGESLYDQVLGADRLDRRVRIYAPVGSHQTLLAYLVRRLLENGANASFVNQVVDENLPVDELIADPVERAAVHAGAPHPRIALPPALYGAVRRNAAGFDLASEAVREAFAEALRAGREKVWSAAPLVASAHSAQGQARVVRNPADARDIVGEAFDAAPAQVDAALQAAADAAPRWAATAPAARAAMLCRAADALEADAPQLVALLVREAGKTWSNALAEVREAVDFCRYYAAQGADFDPACHVPRGPVVAISPWNFPLAIFTGQIAAALAAGNPVLAKPAAQTPLIAARAVAVLHAAGVPRAVLQLLPGAGAVVGAALVGDARIRAVMFTGSTAVARGIAGQLAARDAEVPLIAETGGQNAMIVDSTALPEQVAADVMASAFDSAGQRCSALRVLCLQDDIAEPMLAMLKGAMAACQPGCPEDVRSDVGPVIDAAARDALLAHVAAMRAAGRRVFQIGLPAGCEHGSFVPPTLIEIESMDVLTDEVFGPVLHVLRYRAEALPALVDAINATGYGLTLGIHSRIDERIDFIVGRARVGNIYVNRNMVGAVVGVQPFGGQGRSGTGPKAGGPLYLHRLLDAPPAPQIDAAVPARPALERFAAWLASDGPAWLDAAACARLTGWIDHWRTTSLAGRACRLRGPTGEDNRLDFLPRGTLGAVAHDAAGWLHQIGVALATGNALRIEDDAAVHALLAALPEALRAQVSVVPAVSAADVDAVLFAGSGAAATALRGLLAARPGAIVALLTPTPDYDLTRLIVERTVSINTAAAGGNAALMALAAG